MACSCVLEPFEYILIVEKSYRSQSYAKVGSPLIEACLSLQQTTALNYDFIIEESTLLALLLVSLPARTTDMTRASLSES